ncbi:MAG: ATPase, T2SS/T4P/T4SS family [Kiritimatiellia bacterium]
MHYSLNIAHPGQPVQAVELLEGSYTIGRGEACKIRLRLPEISERHALLVIRDNQAFIEDLHSSNGVLVNGVTISGPVRLSNDSVVSIGPCLLRVFSNENERGTEPPPAPSPNTQHTEQKRAENVRPTTPSQPTSSHAPSQQDGQQPAPPNPMLAIIREIKSQINRELVQRLDLKRMTASNTSPQELETKVKATIRTIISEVQNKQRLPGSINAERLEREIYNEAMRLGPLEDFLEDDSITEIMVNGPNQVYIERDGKLVNSGQTFMDDESVLGVIERIVAPIGRRIDESQPYVDARLPDGSRVNAIIAPLSLIGPCITIRKFSKKVLTVEDFINFGTWTQDAADVLRICVLMRKNIVVAGGTGSGKTTLLNLLSSFIPETDRIVTIEDAAELRLNQPHVVRLESRPPNIEGRGAIPIRDLVRNSLRMRPDRIIVGECRGGESLDMLQAMNTGHDGSLTTVHANSPRDVISRLETMVLMSGMDLPSRAIREQIASAVDIIVHESRMSDGSRKVTYITEVVGLEGQQVVMQDLFEFKQTGLDENAKVTGQLLPTGAMPTFYEHLATRGLEIDPTVFDPSGKEGYQ